MKSTKLKVYYCVKTTGKVVMLKILHVYLPSKIRFHICYGYCKSTTVVMNMQ